MPTKILLDTDIGSDIDDAVCLAYLLAQPACELLGITTVTGEATLRASMASALCKVAGRELPIYPGAEQPLLVEPRQPRAPQAAALARWPHETSFARGQAIEFMRQTIHANPGEVTLLAIGPMTNIALLFASDPEIPALLKQLVLMCGAFTEQLPDPVPLEWNALCDPHAAAIVYRAAVDGHRSIGLDVTQQVTMDAREVRASFQHPLLRPVLDFAEVWFEHATSLTFHDPLAAATIFDDQICRFERGAIDLELDDAPSRGRTHWRAGTAHSHDVALAVDRERFLEHFFSVFQ